jgi:hypothetical protein
MKTSEVRKNLTFYLSDSCETLAKADNSTMVEKGSFGPASADNDHQRARTDASEHGDVET